MALALLLVAHAGSAQDGAALLSGRAVDGADGSPIGYASVAIGDPVSGEPISGTLADREGHFRVEGLTAGRYTISLSFPGFDVFETAVLVSELNRSYDLGELRLERLSVENLAEVAVNGQSLGTVWTKPFRVNVTEALRPGENSLEIRVTNLWVNRLIGDQQPGAEEMYTYTTQAFYQADSPLLPSGLLGPVQIVSRSMKP